MEGGKLIDKGLYGCIFRPSLRCKYKSDSVTSPSKKQITKVLTTENALIEFKIGEIIRRIPLWRNYFAVSESICVPSEKQIDTDLKHCKQYSKKEDTRILSMAYHGTSLKHAKLNLHSFKLMDCITHLLEAGALLALHGVVHRDLHPGNVVIDNYNIPRVIDFNLSILSFNGITINKLEHTSSPIFRQLPPDYIIVNALYKRRYSLNQISREILSKNPTIKLLSRYCNIPLEQLYTDMVAFSTTSNSVSSGDMIEWFKLYWRVLDSWAIGALILEIINKMSIWPSFSQQYKENEHIIIPLLRKLCAINPVKRFDCVQAVHYLNPSNRIIRLYGQKWIEEYSSLA